MTEESDNTVKKEKYWLFEKGKSGNPKGRPKGSYSIKDTVRKYLQSHPTDYTEFIHYFIKENRELVWQMLEGKPPQDVTSGGEKIQQVPIYGGLSKHNSNKKDIPTDQKN